MADKNHGGRWFLSKVEPGTQAFVYLTFQAPPDTVRAVDVVFPWFSPFEATAIVGEGGAQQSGVAVAGKSVELERVLKDLNAAVTPQEIKVNLSADLLFDFDKADLKPEAEPSLGKVVTVLRSYPNARVSIEGHADGKGNENYNQKLSERRAAAAAQWLIQHSGISAANVQTRGWGKSKPIAANTYPNGADYPEGRAKNRRVEIVITH
jgi:outer membrane protein OmpA-like peptidoglycan-associated protein